MALIKSILRWIGNLFGISRPVTPVVPPVVNPPIEEPPVVPPVEEPVVEEPPIEEPPVEEPSVEEPPVENKPFTGRKGIDIMWPFMGPLVVNPKLPTTRYQKDVFNNPQGGWAAHISAETIQQIVDAGFDHIRLSVHPGPWMEAVQENNQARVQELFALINRATDDLIKAGLGVNIDMHLTDYVIYKVRPILSDRTMIDLYIRVIDLFAKNFLRYPTEKLALSLFNEPPTTEEFTLDWPSVQYDMYKMARATMTKHTLILTFSGFASIDDMKLVNPKLYDENTLFDVHPYRPAIFAIQGAAYSDYNRYVFGLGFPPVAKGKPLAIAEMTKQVQANTALSSAEKTKVIADQTRELNYYFDVPLGEKWIESELKRIVNWATTNSVDLDRIYIGEFGVTRSNADWSGPPTISRSAYLQVMYRLLNQLNLRWSVFSLDAIDYGITVGIGQTVGKFDPDLLDTL